ncbi:ATP-dependent RNA helicase DEAH12, chloroplastic-like [Anneissia japonica]|uniref:ATP-dependent RNA helicase DEAH12, chloroplastic-like n=1 Tax=Anneissia japonica TaxID=1529436 RepID=UPI00142555CB|nr:ATP-dependent RNA helicase DEAH12, chloroplastic-like [Anneissia japonica]
MKDKMHRSRRRNSSESRANQGSREERRRQNEQTHHGYKEGKKTHDIDQKPMRSKSRDSRPCTARAQAQQCKFGARSSDTRVRSRCWDPQKTFNSQPTVDHFQGFPMSCVPLSQDQITFFENHEMKYVGFNLLKSNYGEDTSNVTVQCNSRNEAEMCKNLILENFEVHDTDVTSINENSSPSGKAAEEQHKMHSQPRKQQAKRLKDAKILDQKRIRSQSLDSRTRASKAEAQHCASDTRDFKENTIPSGKAAEEQHKMHSQPRKQQPKRLKDAKILDQKRIKSQSRDSRTRASKAEAQHCASDTRDFKENTIPSGKAAEEQHKMHSQPRKQQPKRLKDAKILDQKSVRSQSRDSRTYASKAQAQHCTSDTRNFNENTIPSGKAAEEQHKMHSQPRKQQPKRLKDAKILDQKSVRSQSRDSRTYASKAQAQHCTSDTRYFKENTIPSGKAAEKQHKIHSQPRKQQPKRLKDAKILDQKGIRSQSRDSRTRASKAEAQHCASDARDFKENTIPSGKAAEEQHKMHSQPRKQQPKCLKDAKILDQKSVRSHSRDSRTRASKAQAQHCTSDTRDFKENTIPSGKAAEEQHKMHSRLLVKKKPRLEDAKVLEILNLPPKTQQGEVAQLVTERCTVKPRDIRITKDRALLVYPSRSLAIQALRENYGVKYKGRLLDIRLRKRDLDMENTIFNDLKDKLKEEMNGSVSRIILQWDQEIKDLKQRITEINNNRRHKFVPLEEAEAIDVIRKDLTFKSQQLLKFKLELKQFSECMLCKINQADQIGTVGKMRNYLWREIRKAENPLPIYAYRCDIVSAVFSPENSACVILGETGSGKSTQIAQYLANSDILIPTDTKIRIACTQPRKVAAISLAKRVAEEFGCEVGDEVGHIVGSFRKTSLNTVITFLTDRVLLNMLLQDPKLEDFSCIIIDEAHERSIDTDILIAQLKQVSIQRPELKIVITSATIDEQIFCKYFNNCPYMKIPGRVFPVETIFTSDATYEVKTDYVKEAVQMAQLIHETEEPGDILVFLTSSNEIERACGDLAKRLGIVEDNGDVQILPLHGKLQPQDQMAIFTETPAGKRKVVFATNIAETSVTINGIKYVVDTGMAKERRYDPKRNMSVLEVTMISKASAEQRKGRAGRTSTGKCFRLYSEKDYDEMESNNKPEILRVHLGMAVLQLLQLGIQNVEHFEFVQPPQEGALGEALNMLEFLGAVSKDSHDLTDVGRQMSSLTLEPRLAKLVLSSIENNMAEEGILVAGLLAAGGNVFYRSGSDVQKRKSDESKLDFSNILGDVFTMLDVYDEWKRQPEKGRTKWCIRRSINGKTMKIVTDYVKDIKSSLKSNNILVGKSCDIINWKDEKRSQCLRKILLSVYAQNLCIYNGHPKAGYTIVFQLKTGILHPSSSLKSLDVFPKWIIYTELSRTTQDFLVNLTPVEHDWIFEVVPCLAECIDFELLSENQVHEEIVHNVGATLMGRIIGKRGQGLRKLEEQVSLVKRVDSSIMKTVCVIECNNQKGTVDVFVSKNVAAETSTLVKRTVSEERSSLEKQQLEVNIGNSLSGVRQVLGKGAEPKFILMPDDFRTLEVSNVTDESSIYLYFWLENEDLKNNIHDVFTFPTHSKQAKRGVWGKVTFISPLIAQRAQQLFPEDNTMKCKAVCQGGQQIRGLEQELVATWKTGPSKRFAFITCENVADASLLLPALNGLIVKNSRILCSFKKNDASSLFLRGLGSDITEEDIERAIQQTSDITCKRVSVPRHAPLKMKTDSQYCEDLKNLLVKFTDKARIGVHIPQKEMHQRAAKDDTPRSKHMKAFLKLNQVPADIITQMIAEVPSLSNKVGHQLVIKRVVNCSIFCPEYIFKIIEDELMDMKRKAEKTFRAVRIRFNKKASGVFINFQGNNPDDLMNVKAEFVKLINGEELMVAASSRVLRKISGNYWRQFLDAVQQTTATHAFLDQRDKVIRIYGSDEGIQNMKESINAFISKAESNFCEIELGEFTKAKGRALQMLRKVFGPDLNNLKMSSGAESVSYVFKSRIVVVYGESDTQNKIRGLIKDCLQQEGIDLDQEDVIEEDDCGVCFSPVENDSHRLEGCGHNYCKECLMNLLQHSVESKEFPVICPRENCPQLLFMCDINILTRSGQTRERLYAATLDAFIAQKSNGEYKYCITPNCTMVYRVSRDGGLFICPQCSQQFCTSCRLDHPGMTCREYKANKVSSDSVMDWAKKNQKDVKTCKCGALIEKNGGCLKMHCTKCHKSMCWVCSKVFDTERQCYDHLRDAHGGIFDH